MSSTSTPRLQNAPQTRGVPASGESATPAIDAVLPRLQAIVDGSVERGSREGYFAALYLRVTEEVKRRVIAGEFEDGLRMDRLDAIFAERYLDAHDAYHGGRPVTTSWKVAFDAAGRWRPLILQHLLLGMNAHINLDLGIATVEAADGAPLANLRADFDHINAVLSSLTDEVEAAVARSAPLVSVLDLFAGRSDEMLADFSIELARDGAFAFAQQLAAAPDSARADQIAARDQVIALLGTAIARPGLLISLATLPVRLLERGTVSEVIRRLGS